jgi:hypothetical protein
VTPEDAEAAYLRAIYHKALEATGHEKEVYCKELEEAPVFISTMRKLEEYERPIEPEPAKPDAAA